MKFIDPLSNEPGETRTKFHQLDCDIQIAIEELSHVLADLGFQVVIKNVSSHSDIEIRITNHGN